MSGHSKWAGIKHKKALLDAKKSKAFTKVIREITQAARLGGGNPDANPNLRLAIQKAREVNMPSDNVERAIKRGTGELPGISYETIVYEGYGPNGVALMIEALTDNRNRATAELRNILTKNGGNLAGAGSTSWIFQRKGYFIVGKEGVDEDQLMSVALDSGAEDVSTGDAVFEIITAPHDFEKVRTALQQAKFTLQSADLTMIPSSTVKLDGDPARKILALMDMIEDHDDVQHVYANFDVPDSILTEAQK